MTTSIFSLISDPAYAAVDSLAVLGAGRPPLGYGELRAFVERTAVSLQARGVLSGDRVGLVVENGPEAATAFLAVSTASACAPLNPAYREAELEFYLRDLGARFVIVSAELDSPVRTVARALGIEVLELSRDPASPAGIFTLDGIEAPSVDELIAPTSADVALVLHTSGTTARPKIVPLTHRNLCLSASSVADTLRLVTDDRCLNVMPLFHIHGLVAALLGSLSAGASVACTPGFHPLRFFDRLSEHEPTWYTAVPTMHQAVVERAGVDGALARGHRLRFVRSSSASLPIPVLDGLEHVFGVPVIEAYGMTEAAHQITSNPLPPETRKSGSVGRAAGPEVAVLDPRGMPVAPGEVGEVAIRGESVFGGYDGSHEANAAAFVDGWFRTGDEGTIDEDGYLTLRGRIKEIINRGGEKIGPLEVDAVLASHPAVAQVVTFAVPDPRLGEEVAAAVVLHPGFEADERELQDYAVHRLAPFKVPRTVVFVEEIPRGPTGKVQRVALAERLAVGPPVPFDSCGELRPRNALENELEKIWSDVLGLPRVGVRDDFFALGGDSILGAEAVARIRDLVSRPDLPLISIVRAPTVETMVGEIGRIDGATSSCVIPLQETGVRAPLFFVHGLDGDVVGFAALARRLAPEQPFYGVRAPGLDGDGTTPDRVEELADEYLPEIRRIQQRGPYVLGGFCMGAGVAVALAHGLAAEDEDVSLLVLVDPRIRSARSPARRRSSAARLGVRARLSRLGRGRNGAPLSRPHAGITRQIEPLARARDAYRADALDAPAAVFLSTDHGGGVLSDDVQLVLENVVTCVQVAGSHGRRFHVGAVDELAAAMSPVLAERVPLVLRA